MTEKGYFLDMFQREHKTLVKLLKEYPAAKADYKPADKTATAKDLAWKFVAEQVAFVDGAAQGKIEFDKIPPSPATWGEVMSALDARLPVTLDTITKMSEADWESTMDFFVGPGQMGKVRRCDVLWTMMYDMIHHRGQFSIYNRLVGAKVPSIYGPSADEPWM